MPSTAGTENTFGIPCKADAMCDKSRPMCRKKSSRSPPPCRPMPPFHHQRQASASSTAHAADTHLLTSWPTHTRRCSCGSGQDFKHRRAAAGSPSCSTRLSPGGSSWDTRNGLQVTARRSWFREAPPSSSGKKGRPTRPNPGPPLRCGPAPALCSFGCGPGARLRCGTVTSPSTAHRHQPRVPHAARARLALEAAIRQPVVNTHPRALVRPLDHEPDVADVMRVLVGGIPVGRDGRPAFFTNSPHRVSQEGARKTVFGLTWLDLHTGFLTPCLFGLSWERKSLGGSSRRRLDRHGDIRARSQGSVRWSRGYSGQAETRRSCRQGAFGKASLALQGASRSKTPLAGRHAVHPWFTGAML